MNNKFLTGVSAIALSTAAWTAPAMAACVEGPADTFECTSGTGFNDGGRDDLTINVDSAAVISDSGDTFRFGDDSTINVGENGENGGTVSSTGAMAIRGKDGNTANVYGTVAGEDEGISFGDDATVNVSETGEVFSNTKDAISVDDDFIIVNDGTVSGDTGILGKSSDGGTAKITNSGLIEGTGDRGIDVEDDVEIFNTLGAEITGADRGVDAGDELYLENYGSVSGGDGVTADDDAQVTNAGSIEGLSGDGVVVEDDSRIDNGLSTGSNASITGSNDAVVGGEGLIVSNFGTIDGAERGIHTGKDDLTVINRTLGEIKSGSAQAIDGRDNTMVENYGSITSASGVAIDVRDEYDINNYSGGLIEAADLAIDGGDGDGDNTTIEIDNQANATIRSTGDTAIDVEDNVYIRNAGTIDGQGGEGISADAGLYLVNSAGGLIKSNPTTGTAVSLEDGQVYNSGTIVGGSTGIGIHFTDNDETDSSVNNNSGAIITGGTGIQNDDSDGGLSISNSGTINGTGGTAIALNDEDDTVTNTGGTVNGDIVMGDGTNTLTALQGSRITGDVEGGEDVDTLSMNQASWILGDVNTDDDDDEVLLNYGSYITGDVDTGEDDDLVSLQNSAYITGDVDMASGDDILRLSYGSAITGDVDMGAGEGEIEVHHNASITGDVTFGDDGTDTFTVHHNARLTGNLDMGEGEGSVEVSNASAIIGNVTFGDDSDELVVQSGSWIDGDVDAGGDDDELSFGARSYITGDIDTGSGDDSLEFAASASAGGDIDMGQGNDVLALNTIEIDGTVDMGAGGSDTLVVGPSIGYGVIAFSDNVENYDGSDAPITALFTGDFLINADPLVFAGYDALTTRQTFQQSRNIMDASATPGWYGMASGFGGESDFGGGDLLVGYNAENFGAFLSYSKAHTDMMGGLHDFERRNFAVGVKGFAPVGAGMVTGMAYVGRGDGEIDSDMAVTGKGSVDDTSFGLSARFDLLPAGGEGLGFSAEVGASRIKYDSFDPSNLGDAIIDDRDVTASYISLETGYTHALSGGMTVRPFLGAAAMFSDADNVTLLAPSNNSNAPTSTTFATGGDDDLKMLRLGAELGGAGGWTATLEGQFDDEGDTTGIVSFGMNF